MADRRFTLNEVMDGLDGSDFEDDSEDDFEGYLDMDTYQELREEWDEEQQTVGANVEIGAEGGMDLDDSNSVPAYNLQTGCSTSVEGENPYEYFSLLFSDEMLEHIVTQTNLSARQFIESHELCPHSHVRRWSKEVHDTNELRRFLAVILVMGLVRYPQIEHHWATQWPYSNTHFSRVSRLHVHMGTCNSTCTSYLCVYRL